MNRIGTHLAIALFLVIIPLISNAQESNIRKWMRLSGPERRWVIWHPLVALDALSITMNTRKVTKEHHVFWMASLSAEIKWKKAWRLGNAHEKANKKDWRKGRYEDGSPPDKIAGEMDYWNNKIGLDIGKSNQNMSEEDLIQLVIRAITDGKCKIIRRNANGDFLDGEGNIIASSAWQGKWENFRCLIFSNKTR